MSEQDGTQETKLKLPIAEDGISWILHWKEHWEAQDQSWRTEPRIDEEREKYLDERLKIKPDIEQGIYPFKDCSGSRNLNTEENQLEKYAVFKRKQLPGLLWSQRIKQYNKTRDYHDANEKFLTAELIAVAIHSGSHQ